VCCEKLASLPAARQPTNAIESRPVGEPRIGVGLNSGTVSAGNIGGARRFDFSLVGDAANVAARVESATRQTAVADGVVTDAGPRLRHVGQTAPRRRHRDAVR
jgi:class 3 adenylate cyclase